MINGGIILKESSKHSTLNHSNKYKKVLKDFLKLKDQ
jgi:hypothetical protein